MKKVMTGSGEKIDGLFRDSTGALVVSSPLELAKYNKRMAREQEIQALQEQVSSLTNIVQELMNKMDRNNG